MWSMQLDDFHTRRTSKTRKCESGMAMATSSSDAGKTVKAGAACRPACDSAADAPDESAMCVSSDSSVRSLQAWGGSALPFALRLLRDGPGKLPMAVSPAPRSCENNVG